MAQFNPKRRAVSAPKMGGGSSAGLGTLLAYMVSQQKGKGLKQELGPSATATRATDPSTGVTYETPEGQAMDVRTALMKKASDDVLKLESALPILQDLEKSYDLAYQDYSGDTGGMSGAFGALKEYGSGILMRKNANLRSFLDKAGQYEAPLVKMTGDVGNFSAVERESASKGVPKVTPNMDINKLFMPDDVEFGKQKIQSLKNLYASKYLEAKRVAETGEFSAGYDDWVKSNSAYNGGGQAQATSPQASNASSGLNPNDRMAKLQAIKDRYKQRNP